MYVINLFLLLIQKAAKTLWSLCRGQVDFEASTPLVEDQGQDVGRYSSTEALTPSSSGLSLTAEYKRWGQTDQALKLGLMSLFIYFGLAVIGYSFIFEDWPISDSMYFSVVIFTTVGYGDLSPTTNPSRLFTVFLALYGIVILGIFLGMAGGFIVEQQEEKMQKRLGNARLKIMEQFLDQDSSLPPEQRSFYTDIVGIFITLAPAIIILAIIATPIIYIEGWDLVMGVYWMTITGTTIGFGDLDPTKVLTKCICTVYIPLAVAVLGEVLARIAGAIVDRRNDVTEERFMNHAMTFGDLRNMDTDKDGKVSPIEFFTYMLVVLQKVDKEDIDQIMGLFHRLDRSNDGSISKDDLKAQYCLNVKPGVKVNANIFEEAP